MIEVKLKFLNQNGKLPIKATKGSAGFDLYASEAAILKPGEWRLVKTDISIELPEGYEAQVRPRSGLALRHGVTVLNSPGTIDSDYRGEIGVILINLGKESFEVKKGMRIAQLVVSKIQPAIFRVVDSLESTTRGGGGFGSTGEG